MGWKFNKQIIGHSIIKLHQLKGLVTGTEEVPKRSRKLYYNQQRTNSIQEKKNRQNKQAGWVLFSRNLRSTNQCQANTKSTKSHSTSSLLSTISSIPTFTSISKHPKMPNLKSHESQSCSKPKNDGQRNISESKSKTWTPPVAQIITTPKTLLLTNLNWTFTKTINRQQKRQTILTYFQPKSQKLKIS